MKLSCVVMRRIVCLAWVAALVACGSPGYNSNPSQRESDERIGCLAGTDFFAVYFSVHVQPPDLGPDARVTHDLFRPYCSDIPAPGNVFVTVDLVGNELRRVPIAIRLVAPETNESASDGAENWGSIAEVPAKVYAKGVIETGFALDRNGRYAVELIRGGNAGAVQQPDTLRIPLNVGMGADAQPLLKDLLIKVILTVGGLLFCSWVFRLLRARKII
jgi:hypothetical protein